MLADKAVPVIEYVPVGELKGASFNPKSRITKQALHKLRKLIEKAGEILTPLAITDDNYVADGHRRLKVAIDLGYERVPVIRYKGKTLPELWSMFNGALMPVGRPGWLQAYQMGMPLEYLPATERNLVETLLEIAGEDLFNELAEKGRSPWIGQNARLIANYCKRGDDFARKVLLHFEQYKSQNVLRDMMTAGYPPSVIETAVEEMRKIEPTWKMS